MSLIASTEASASRSILSSSQNSFQLLKPCRPHTRPPPIVLVACHSPTDLSTRLIASSSPQISHSFPKSPVEPLDSPAFLKGDLNFSTFRERAARAIAEWGPSPTGAQFPTTDMRSPTPKRNELGPDVFESCSNSALRVPVLRHSTSHPHLSSPPFTPLTPGPHTFPQHREHSSVARPSSLKLKSRPRPSPLKLQSSKYTDANAEQHNCTIESRPSVRFSDRSPLCGSTWHITQYPARLASPPISAANLSLADLVELEAIKQSLGTWCGEIMGSPMRGSFNRSSTKSTSPESTGKKTWAQSDLADEPSESTTSSPASCAGGVNEDHWPTLKWPASPSCDSDCDSEIFEGMH